MSSVISVENLSKKYTLHHQQRESYTALRDVVTNGVAAFGKKLIYPFRRPLHPVPCTLSTATEDFWALKDVSFEVKQGDRIGIIGRNGAGKSTLLKILSRITEPTTGSVRIKGRVASLLEVGTGFHPELTGRENIFLNGAILGMGRAEIKKKFDEIVDFAEIEKFIDTPVKRYSSGMYVRLAFAVAAHLEPEILIVDEVLAVGDAQFQKKCLGKMEDVSTKEGRTVLFVSHNMEAIRTLCNSGILLDQGKLVIIGGITDTITAYCSGSVGINFDETTAVFDEKFRRGSGLVRFTDIKILNTDNVETFNFERGDVIRFLLTFKCFDNVKGLCVSIAFRAGQLDEIVSEVFHQVKSGELFTGEAGQLMIEISTDVFRALEYRLYFWLGNIRMQPFDVVDKLIGPIIINKQRNNADNQNSETGYFNIPSDLSIITETGNHVQ